MLLGVLLTVTAVVIAIAVALGRAVLFASRAHAWPTVDGVITRSELEVDEGTHYLRVEYRYTIGGETHTSDRLRFGGTTGIFFKRNAEAARTRYPLGGRLEVHVDPADPRRSVVETRIGSPIWAGFVTVVILEVVTIYQYVDHS